MKKQTIKKPKTVVSKKAHPVGQKMSKDDPDYYSKIGAISAARRKLSSEYFSDMAVKSHGINSSRTGYFGGRKKKVDPKNG